MAAGVEELGVHVALSAVPVDAADVPVVASAGADDTSGGEVAGIEDGVVPSVALGQARG